VGTRLGSKQGITLGIIYRIKLPRYNQKSGTQGEDQTGLQTGDEFTDNCINFMEKNGEQKNGPLLFDPAEDRVAPVDPLGFGAVSATEEGRRAREQRREARSSDQFLEAASGDLSLSLAFCVQLL